MEAKDVMLLNILSIHPSIQNKNENIYFMILIVTIRKHHNPLIINKPEHEI